MDPNLKAILVYDGGDTVVVPKEMGIPRGDQMLGTPRERLCELAGRVCYDSMGTPDSRPSFDVTIDGKLRQGYHSHIAQVNHTSVWAAANFTVELPYEYLEIPKLLTPLLLILANRPGVLVDVDDQAVRVTMNFRAAYEFQKWKPRASTLERLQLDGAAIAFERMLQLRTRELAPHIMTKQPTPAQIATSSALFGAMRLVPPKYAHEKFISMFLSGSRGWCYDAETEVLTDEGWKQWPTVRGDEQFATLDPATGVLEYQAATAVVRENYSGDMYRLKSKMVDLLVTPNHRMFVQKHDTQAAKRGEEPYKVYTAREIVGKRVKYKRDAEWVGTNPRCMEIPAVTVTARNVNHLGPCGSRTVVCTGKKIKTQIFAKFMGYWLAEGSLDHTDGGGYFAVLSQDMRSPEWEAIIRCVTEMGYPYSVKRCSGSATMRQIRISGGKALYDYLMPFSGSLTKAIPPECHQWSPKYQRLLIDSYLAGDGSFTRGGSGEGNTISRQLADDLQVAALKAGWSATVRPVDRRDEPARLLNGKPISHKHIVYVVSFCKIRNRPLVNHNGKQHDSIEQYTGRIYCVTVPNGLLYVRRNGRPVWSGNSHEQVRHTFRCGISQRSTRFVDETDSPWVEHPLLTAFARANPTAGATLREEREAVISESRECYAAEVDVLQQWLLSKGVDKVTARKQARGAARGMLGNALLTEMIFTANVPQWREMITQRLNPAADAEIRQVFVPVLEQLKQSRYAEDFLDISLLPAKDGIGQVAVFDADRMTG